MDKKLVETKSVTGGDTVARVLAATPQWSYVSFWFGQTVPAGKVVIRFKVYVDDGTPATYGIYAHLKSGQTLLGKLTIPADAKKDSVVDIDQAVNQPEEWNGVLLKKNGKHCQAEPLDRLGQRGPALVFAGRRRMISVVRRQADLARLTLGWRRPALFVFPVVSLTSFAQPPAPGCHPFGEGKGCRVAYVRSRVA